MRHYLKFSYSLALIGLLGTSCQKEALMVPDQPVAAASTLGRSPSPPSRPGVGKFSKSTGSATPYSRTPVVQTNGPSTVNSQRPNESASSGPSQSRSRSSSPENEDHKKVHVHKLGGGCCGIGSSRSPLPSGNAVTTATLESGGRLIGRWIVKLHEPTPSNRSPRAPSSATQRSGSGSNGSNPIKDISGTGGAQYPK